MSLLGLVNRELATREDSGWEQIIVDSPEDEAKLAELLAAQAEGRLRKNLIIRRVVAPPVWPNDYLTRNPLSTS